MQEGGLPDNQREHSSTTPVRTRINGKILLGLTIACALIIAGLLISRQPQYPVLGIDPIPTVQIVENHKYFFPHWLAKGFNDAVLINLDAHDDIKRVSPANLASLRKLVSENSIIRGNPAYQQAADLVQEGNFIHAAANLGVFSEVYWVVPSSLFQFNDQKEQLAKLLKYNNFLDSEIETFKMTDRCFKGMVDDIPLNVCGIENLPEIREPVVLSIDMDFIPYMAQDYRENITLSVKRILESLFAREYQILDLQMAYSVDNGHLRTSLRWVGDLFRDFVMAPSKLSGHLPEKYQVLKHAEILLSRDQYQQVRNLLIPVLNNDINDPAVLTYMAEAIEGMGSLEMAFNCAERACLADMGYCYELCEMGCRVLNKYGLTEAERFFTRGYEQNPDMSHSQFTLARAMQKTGRFGEAIQYYKEFRRHHGPFPVDFYIAENYLLLGKEMAALGYYSGGKDEIVRNPHAWVGFGDLGIINRAIDFFIKVGRHEDASELEASLAARDKLFQGRRMIMPAGQVS